MVVEECLKQLKWNTFRDFAKRAPFIAASLRSFFARLPYMRSSTTVAADFGKSTVTMDAVDLNISGTITLAAAGSEEKEESKDKLAVETLQEYWTLEDELKDCLTLPAKYIKAARLRKMQRQTDFVLPSVEAERLLLAAREDMQNYGRSEVAVDESMFLYFDSSETVKRARYRFRGESKQDLIDALTAVRIRAELVKRELESIIGDHNEVEMHLFRKFLVYLFTGFKRKIAERHLLLQSIKTINSVYFAFAAMILAIITIGGIFGGMLYFLFLYNHILGSRALDMWLLVFTLCLLEGAYLKFYFFQC